MIPKETFLTMYDEDMWDRMTTIPESHDDLMAHYFVSKLWRMNNLYRIIDKDGDDIPFRLNMAQFFVYHKSLEHWRLVILKSRQQGISTLWLISYFDDIITRCNLNCGLMAQGKDEAATLLERLKHVWNTLDPWVKEFFSVRILKDNSSEFKLSNSSTMFIRTSFRSATLQRLHISELGKIANKYPERARETKTGTLQALAPGNMGIIESTAEGHNMFKTIWDSSVKQYAAGNLAGKDFLPVFLPWFKDPDCVEFETQYPDDEEIEYFARLERTLDIKLAVEQKNFWIAQHRELEGDIHQEYPATPEEAFTAAQNGTYWAKRYLECVIRTGHKKSYDDLYDSNLPVFVVCDAGRNDYMVLLFFQIWRGQARIIGEYYNSGEYIGFYAREAERMAEENGWDIEKWFLPHDMGVVDLTQAENKTREEVLNDEGVLNTLCLERNGLREGIEEVRQGLADIWISETCEYIEQCCLNYTKEWNPVGLVWRDQPKKNRWCHGADAVRYLIQTVRVYFYESSDDNIDQSVINGLSI